MTFRDDLDATAAWVASYLERVGELPVFADVEPGDVRAALAPSPPDDSEPFGDVLRDIERTIVPGLTHWNHPRFFAYFATTGSEPGILAELVTAALNVNAMMWRTSPAATELDELTLDWLAQLLGLPRGWHGHIEDTASTSTLVALAAAREATGGRVVVCSDQAHSSVAKAAKLLGLDVRQVPTTESFELDLEQLDLSDAAAVVATVGTTATTAVDPVASLADLAGDVWLHVDAAYAGSAMVCPEFRWAFEGVARADSLVVNPHKWLFTPVDCSCIYTSRPDDVRRAFSVVPDYLRSADDATNLMDYGHALGRRFRALKLWAVIRCYGRSGLQRTIREHVRLAERFEQWVRDDPDWELAAPRHFGVVCFRRKASDEQNEAVLERVNRSGRVFLSGTRLRGRFVLRLAIGNARTGEDDVRAAWEALRESAAG